MSPNTSQWPLSLFSPKRSIIHRQAGLCCGAGGGLETKTHPSPHHVGPGVGLGEGAVCSSLARAWLRTRPSPSPCTPPAPPRLSPPSLSRRIRHSSPLSSWKPIPCPAPLLRALCPAHHPATGPTPFPALSPLPMSLTPPQLSCPDTDSSQDPAEGHRGPSPSPWRPLGSWPGFPTRFQADRNGLMARARASPGLGSVCQRHARRAPGRAGSPPHLEVPQKHIPQASPGSAECREPPGGEDPLCAGALASRPSFWGLQGHFGDGRSH